MVGRVSIQTQTVGWGCVGSRSEGLGRHLTLTSGGTGGVGWGGDTSGEVTGVKGGEIGNNFETTGWRSRVYACSGRWERVTDVGGLKTVVKGTVQTEEVLL